MQYGEFSLCYDKVIEQDYAAWTAFITKLFSEHDQKIESVIDLACGTGNLTLPLAELGYEMIGVDLSPEMLSAARMKEGAEKVLWLCQGLDELDLYGTSDAAVSILDGLNYLTEDGEAEDFLGNLYNFLNPDGLLILDFSTRYKLETEQGNNTFAQEIEDIFYVWENSFEYPYSTEQLHIFSKEGSCYRRSDETHILRAYEPEDVEKMLKENGFIPLRTMESLTGDTLRQNSQRITMVAKKMC